MIMPLLFLCSALYGSEFPSTNSDDREMSALRSLAQQVAQAARAALSVSSSASSNAGDTLAAGASFDVSEPTPSRSASPERTQVKQLAEGEVSDESIGSAISWLNVRVLTDLTNTLLVSAGASPEAAEDLYQRLCTKRPHPRALDLDDFFAMAQQMEKIETLSITQYLEKYGRRFLKCCGAAAATLAIPLLTIAYGDFETLRNNQQIITAQYALAPVATACATSALTILGIGCLPIPKGHRVTREIFQQLDRLEKFKRGLQGGEDLNNPQVINPDTPPPSQNANFFIRLKNRLRTRRRQIRIWEPEVDTFQEEVSSENAAGVGSGYPLEEIVVAG